MKVRVVLREVRLRLHGLDLALTSAAATLYGALAVVPSLLVAIALSGDLLGDDATARYGERLASTLPAAMGAGRGADALVEAGLGLGPLGIVLAVFMGSAYGEGLSRAFVRFAPVPDDARPPAWWLRLVTLPLLGLAPLLLSGLLLASPTLARINERPDGAGRLLAAYLSLTLVWVLLWAPLTWTYRVVGPGRPSWRSALVGAVVAAAFVSGFIQGFIVFLAVPVDLGRPFGGLTGVGVASALLLWLWVMHAVVLVGYCLTWAVDRHQQAPGVGRPSGSSSAPAIPDEPGSPMFRPGA
jgi:membrane protein